MNCCLDYIQIWYGCSLGISDDLINFWDEFIQKHGCRSHLKKIDMVVVGVIFSHYFLKLLRQPYVIACNISIIVMTDLTLSILQICHVT